MKELLLKLNQIKSELKIQRKELSDKLMEDSDMAELYEDYKMSGEAMRSYRTKLIESTPIYGAMNQKIDNKKLELKTIKQALNDSIVITNKQSGEVVQLTLF